LLLVMCFGPVTSHPTNVLLYPNGDDIAFMASCNHPPKVWTMHSMSLSVTIHILLQPSVDFRFQNVYF
jgi:hypothetical protein